MQVRAGIRVNARDSYRYRAVLLESRKTDTLMEADVIHFNGLGFDI